MVVREENASPIVVGSYGELRLAVTGERVGVAARGPLEAGVCSLRDGAQVHQVREVESLHERAVDCIIGARSSPVCPSGRRIGVSHHQNGRRVHYGGDFAPDLGGIILTSRADRDPENGQKVSLLGRVANSETDIKINFPKLHCGCHISQCFTVNSETATDIEALGCDGLHPPNPPPPPFHPMCGYGPCAATNNVPL